MITIILGMHRSGTSTVAGVLHLNKIIMGTYQNFWPRPLTQNPKGFYENYDFTPNKLIVRYRRNTDSIKRSEIMDNINIISRKILNPLNQR